MSAGPGTSAERDRISWQPELDREALWSISPHLRPVRIAGGYPPELLEPVHLDDLTQFLIKAFPQIMRRNGGGMPTMAYLFCTCDPIDGHPEPCLYSVQLREDSKAYSGRAKDFFALMLQILASTGRARAVAFMSEAWTVTAADVGADEAKRLFESGASIADHPKRREMGIIILHQTGRELVTQASASFRRYGPRGIVFDHWTVSHDHNTQGRFSELLKPLTPADFDDLSIREGFRKLLELREHWKQRPE